MLVLTRGIGQEILIDQGKVSVRVLAIKGGKVRIGVSAPQAMVVDRSEVHERRRAKIPSPRELMASVHE